MKDRRTHLAHKAEHAVDLESGALVAVTVQGADQGDTRTLVTRCLRRSLLIGHLQLCGRDGHDRSRPPYT